MTVRSEKSKHRWTICGQIGEHLKLTKHEVHQFLYGEILDKGWLDDAINGNTTILEEIKKLPGWARMVDSKNKVSVTVTLSEKKVEEKCNEDPISQLKLAFWFIKKFDSPEAARKALDAAISVMEKLG